MIVDAGVDAEWHQERIQNYGSEPALAEKEHKMDGLICGSKNHCLVVSSAFIN